MANYLFIQKGSIKTLDRRSAVIFQREIFKDILSKLDEVNQAKYGETLARFINETANREGKMADLNHKLLICENLGYFLRDIDSEGYIYVNQQFGPQKFVEAFMWQLIRQEDFKFLESEMSRNKNLSKQYDKEFVNKEKGHPKSSINYTFEFAKVE